MTREFRGVDPLFAVCILRRSPNIDTLCELLKRSPNMHTLREPSEYSCRGELLNGMAVKNVARMESWYLAAILPNPVASRAQTHVKG